MLSSIRPLNYYYFTRPEEEILLMGYHVWKEALSQKNVLKDLGKSTYAKKSSHALLINSLALTWQRNPKILVVFKVVSVVRLKIK